MEIAVGRRVRAFKRWMNHRGIQYSDALDLILFAANQSLSITALADLHVGDAVATIPSPPASPSSPPPRVTSSTPYLAVLPEREAIPPVWTAAELLRGTELEGTVKEDRAVMLEDWKESIAPLQGQIGQQFERFFGFENYLAARTLIASRSFQIDDHYHGVGMVPLADIFNHKTGAEDVRLNTSASSEDSESEEGESGGEDGNAYGNESRTSTTSSVGPSTRAGAGATDDVVSSDGGDDDLEMVMVKDVKARAEVFNIYRLLGNAALLHRCGFTEPDNPFDIVNIDLDLYSSGVSLCFLVSIVERDYLCGED